MPGRSVPAEDHDDGPDPSEFWRWVHRSVRPHAGWIFIGAAFLFILLGYLGVSREALPAKQLPYLVSGGIGGIVFSVLGAYFLGTEALRRDSGRLDRLERMVEELHGVLLTRPDAPALDAEGSPNGGRSRRTFVVVEGTETFHDASCAAVAGKGDVTWVSAAAVDERGLQPCPLCEPSPADIS